MIFRSHYLYSNVIQLLYISKHTQDNGLQEDTVLGLQKYCLAKYCLQNSSNSNQCYFECPSLTAFFGGFFGSRQKFTLHPYVHQLSRWHVAHNCVIFACPQQQSPIHVATLSVQDLTVQLPGLHPKHRRNIGLSEPSHLSAASLIHTVKWNVCAHVSGYLLSSHLPKTTH